MNLHEIEKERQEARQKVKLEYIKNVGFRDIDELNQLQSSDVTLWLTHWIEIHNRLEAKGLATSITRRCNHRGLLEDETESRHLNSDETCRVFPMEPRRVVELSDKRPREWAI
jgi:hypothetical protein